jgi:hypothetical protein
MKTTRSEFFVLVIFLGAFSIAGKQAGAALVKPDSDQPFSISLGAESTVEGNPLERDDDVYTLQGSYRFFRGDLGFGASLGYAQPSSDLVPGANEELELFLLDFSLIWYANYAQQERIWRRAEKGGLRIKPEVVVFGGPGYASLRVKDAHPGSQFSDAVDDFFTLNAGVGVKLYRFQGEDLTTSRWFVFPKVQARWFGGQENSVDWGVGLSVGVTFGKRPSRRALEILVKENCTYVTDVYSSAAGVGERGPTAVGVSCDSALEDREGLEELSGQVALCGERCAHLRCIEEALEMVRETVSVQGCEGGDVE